MRSNSLYAPDGMTSHGAAGFAGSPHAAQARDPGVRADDRYDDGLVHNHGWAVSGDGGPRSTRSAGWTPAQRVRDLGIVLAHERHDDGLVHNHEWAVSGK